MEVISLDASIERVCNISSMTFQKFPLAFRAGQFVDIMTILFLLQRI